MQRNIFALIVGTTLVGAAALASCSGGGGSSPSPLAATGSTAPGNATQSNDSGLTLTLTIGNGSSTPKKPFGTRRAAAERRTPQYIDPGNGNGLQIAVLGGGSAKTVYADISQSSPLCTPTVNAVRTCTLSVPTVAATETITATEVDQTPGSEGTGYPAGYGSGFPVTSNVLAAGTTTATISGQTSVTLGLSPVLAQLFDGCVDVVISSSVATSSNFNAGIDFTNEGTSPDRLVVTSGVAQTLLDCIYWENAAYGNNFNQNSSPLPLVDVNASPEPLTIVSSSQGVTVEALPSPLPSTPPTPTATAAAITSTSYMQFGDCFFFAVRLDGTQTLNPISTVSVSSNLSATSPYVGTTPPPIHNYTYEVVPLTVSAVSGPVSVTGSVTANVTGSDFQGTGGLLPYGAVTNANGLQYSGECVDSGGTEHATVTSAGAISTTTWQQTFTIAPVLAGACSFVLVDGNTFAAYQREWNTVPVITPAVSVTVGS